MTRAQVRRIGVAVAAGLVIAVTASSAQAAFPGRNGRIVFERWSCGYRISALHTARFDGSRVRQLTQGGCDAPVTSIEPRWAPGGKRFLFIRNVPPGREGVSDARKVILASADGGDERVADRATMNSLEWAPSGGRLASLSGQELYVGRFGSLESQYIAPAASVAWSPDGRRLAVTDPQESPESCPALTTFDPENGRRLETLVDGSSFGVRCSTSVHGPDWAPDGRRLVFTSTGPRPRPIARATEIYLVNANGSGLRRVTHNRRFEGSVKWSPDGRWLLYIRTRQSDDGPVDELWRMRPDGSRNRLVLRDVGAYSIQRLRPFRVGE